MPSVGDLVANLTMNTAGFSRGANVARGTLGGLKGSFASVQSSFGSIGSSIGSTLGGIGASFAAVGVGAAVMGVKLAATAEQSQISFEVMLGSAEKAKGMLSQLKSYADKSPFDVAGVNAAAEKLLNYNIQGQDVLPTIKMLGDVAAGNMEKFDRLSTAFGQTASAGRLMGQDLLQYIAAGFNPLQEISKKTGESMAQLKKRMEGGGISAMEVKDAFVAATSEGGRFFQMTERQSQTFAGKFSTMKDAASTALRQLGENLISNLNMKGWLDYITDGLGKVPFIFQNAGTLLHAELLNWNIYFMELVPEFESTMGDIGIIFSAVWEAMSKNSHLFFASVKGGIQELTNLTRSAKAGLTGAVAGAWDKSLESMRGTMDWLDAHDADGNSKPTTANMLLGPQKPKDPKARDRGMGGLLGAAADFADYSTLGGFGWATGMTTSFNAAAQPVLANQKDAMKSGTVWATNFTKDYNAAVAKAVSGPGGGIGNAEKYKQERERLLKSLIPSTPIAETGPFFDGKPGDSFNSSTGNGNSKSDSKSGSSGAGAALFGTLEANKIMTSRFDNSLESIAKNSFDQLVKMNENLTKVIGGSLPGGIKPSGLGGIEIPMVQDSSKRGSTPPIMPNRIDAIRDSLGIGRSGANQPALSNPQLLTTSERIAAATEKMANHQDEVASF